MRASTIDADRSSAGGAKLQWKVDWAMRWVALGVDYEMSGKDLIDSVIQSSKIARVLGGRPPEGFNYEMFLDEKGEKISKTKGNGLTIEQWLTYGPDESLAFYIYPRAAGRPSRCTSGVIPRAVDEYWQFRGNYRGQPVEQRLGNPVHHIHNGPPPAGDAAGDVRAAAQPRRGDGPRRPRSRSGAISPTTSPDATPETYPALDELIGYALAYARDFVAPTLQRRAPAGVEAAALARARRRAGRAARRMPSPRTSRTRSTRSARPAGSRTCATGSRRSTRPCSDPSQGPRMGSFIALYGIANTRKLIAEALARA